MSLHCDSSVRRSRKGRVALIDYISGYLPTNWLCVYYLKFPIWRPWRVIRNFRERWRMYHCDVLLIIPWNSSLQLVIYFVWVVFEILQYIYSQPKFSFRHAF